MSVTDHPTANGAAPAAIGAVRPATDDATSTGGRR